MARKSDVPTKTISLTGDHIYMPQDLLTAKWEDCAETARYERRITGDDGESRVAKYTVHAELADFMIGRDQAMEVMPDQEPAA